MTEPLFEIRAVASNTDREYAGFTDITVRIHEGFDWNDPKLRNGLFKKLQKAENWTKELNSD